MIRQSEDQLRPILSLFWTFVSSKSKACIPMMYLSCDRYLYFSLEVNKLNNCKVSSLCMAACCKSSYVFPYPPLPRIYLQGDLVTVQTIPICSLLQRQLLQEISICAGWLGRAVLGIDIQFTKKLPICGFHLQFNT